MEAKKGGSKPTPVKKGGSGPKPRTNRETFKRGRPGTQSTGPRANPKGPKK